MKILNLKEGSFPIKLNLAFDSLSIPDVGKLQNQLNIEASISRISKSILKRDGYISGMFIDICQNCLNKTNVEINNKIEVAIKDSTELLNDSSDQDQPHYQD